MKKDFVRFLSIRFHEYNKLIMMSLSKKERLKKCPSFFMSCRRKYRQPDSAVMEVRNVRD